MFRVELGHSVEQNREDVGEAEIEKENFYQRPILFVIVALYKVDFEFFHLFEALGKFGHNEEPYEEELLQTGGEVDDKDDIAD